MNIEQKHAADRGFPGYLSEKANRYWQSTPGAVNCPVRDSLSCSVGKDARPIPTIAVNPYDSYIPNQENLP